MDTTDGGSRDGLLDENVVRLPRDWLGPREELIPFGRSDEPVSATALPPTADDFWGESSASVQDALQAPPTDRSPQVPAPLPGNSRLPRVFKQHPVLSIAALSAVVVLGLVVLIGAGAQRSASRGSPATRTIASSTLTGALYARAEAGSRAFERARRREATAERRRARLARRARARAEARQRRQAQASAAIARPARSTSAVQSRSPSQSTGPAEPTSPVETSPAPSSAGESPAPSPSTGSSSSASAAAGSTAGSNTTPASQPAFGLNGSLGPGHGNGTS